MSNALLLALALAHGVPKAGDHTPVLHVMGAPPAGAACPSSVMSQANAISADGRVVAGVLPGSAGRDAVLWRFNEKTLQPEAPFVMRWLRGSTPIGVSQTGEVVLLRSTAGGHLIWRGDDVLPSAVEWLDQEPLANAFLEPSSRKLAVRVVGTLPKATGPLQAGVVRYNYGWNEKQIWQQDLRDREPLKRNETGDALTATGISIDGDEIFANATWGFQVWSDTTGWREVRPYPTLRFGIGAVAPNGAYALVRASNATQASAFIWSAKDTLISIGLGPMSPNELPDLRHVSADGRTLFVRGKIAAADSPQVYRWRRGDGFKPLAGLMAAAGFSAELSRFSFDDVSDVTPDGRTLVGTAHDRRGACGPFGFYLYLP